MVAGVDFGKMHRSTSLQSSKLIYDGKWKVEMFGATASSTKARRVWRGARRRGGRGGPELVTVSPGGQTHSFIFL